MMLRLIAVIGILFWIWIFFKGFKERSQSNIYLGYIIVLFFLLIFLIYKILKNGDSISAFLLFLICFISVLGAILWLLKLIKWEDFEILNKKFFNKKNKTD